MVLERAEPFSGFGGFHDTAYAYDLADKVTQMTYPSGRLVGYEHDAAGRVERVTTQADVLAPVVELASDIRYEPFGPLRQVVYGNGLTRTVTYDQDYRPTSIATGSALALDYGYTVRDEVATLAKLATAQSLAYDYDATGRLEAETDGATTTSYGYDANGNRVSRVAPGRVETHAYEAGSNRLDAITIDTGVLATRQVNVDARGRIDADDGLAALIDPYRHTQESFHLQGVPGGAFEYRAVWNGYDHRELRRGDLRIEVVSGQPVTAAWTAHVHDAGGMLLGEYDESPASVRREYVYLNGEPLALFDPTQANAGPYWYHNDHLGTPQVLTDASQAVQWKAKYDAFGNATLQVAAIEQPLRFPGQYAEPWIPGLHYNWHRYYDATTGRYLSSDPIGLAGGINTYGYALNAPTLYTDPEGLFVPFAFAAVEVAVATAARQAALSAARAVAAVAVPGAAQSASTPDVECTDNACPPCMPHAEGTIGYIGPHADDHFNKKLGRHLNPHLNLFEVNQNKSDCKCRWNKSKLDSAPPPPLPNWVNLNNGFPALFP